MNALNSEDQEPFDKPPKRPVTKADAHFIFREQILSLLRVRNHVSADDLHRHLDIPRDCMHILAPAFRALQQQGLIRKVQIVNTPRPGQHGNRIAIWELVPLSEVEVTEAKTSRKTRGKRA